LATSLFALLLVKYIFEACDLRGFAICVDSVGAIFQQKECNLIDGIIGIDGASLGELGSWKSQLFKAFSLGKLGLPVS